MQSNNASILNNRAAGQPNQTAKLHDLPAPVALTKAEQSKINGSKSRGPVTDQGKAASSPNALKHGLRAEKHGILDVEDSAEFHAIRECAIQEFRPHSVTMLRMVHALHDLEWTLTRLRALETAYLNIEVNRVLGIPLPDPIQQAKETGDPIVATLLGWINSTGGKGNMPDLMRRYSVSLQSKYNQTLNNYIKLEKRHTKFKAGPEYSDRYTKPELPPSALGNDAQPGEPTVPNDPKIEAPEIAAIPPDAQPNEPEPEPVAQTHPTQAALPNQPQANNQPRGVILIMKNPPPPPPSSLRSAP